MRLLFLNEEGEFCFTDDHHDATKPYAVLSHTWLSTDEELTYQDMKQKSGQQKPGYAKLQFLAQQAAVDGYKYFWIDTCCIDKQIDAEIKEAIRAMFRWYQNSAVCYVYLEDVSDKKRQRDGTETWQDTFRNCRWFKRGWTLQELIGPKEIKFFARGDLLGTKESLSQLIEEATGISKDIFLPGGISYGDVKIQLRLQWINGRETTKPEDLIYCQMGICGVTLNPRYGEGIDEAQRRFNKKIREYHGASASERLSDSQLSEPTSLSRNTSFWSATDSQTSQHNVPQSRLDRLKFDAMDTRSKGIAKAIGKTCSWFLEDPTFKQWISPTALKDHHGFMWIKGKPGAGKSVLMKFLESNTQKKKKRKDICIAFYFNARGVKLEKSLSGMYRTIICKLLAAVPDLQHILESSSLDSDDENESYLDELMRVIQQASLELQDRELTIFVDALDECRDGEVQQMIDFFRDLCWDGHADGINIRVCFASRHYPIVKVPTGLQLTLENASGHTTDLESYVDLHLELGTPEQILSVKTDVLEKSNGVFLWVILVIKILNEEFLNGRIHAVRKRLKEMPEDLADLFSDIINRDNKNLDECLLCIRWILYAKRPLSLKEFYFAMMAGLEDESLVWNNQITEQQMHTFLTTSSKGLAELTRGAQPTVQFIHESVRDYLVLKGGLKQLQHDKSSEEDHEILKICCFKGMEDNEITTLAMSTRVKSGSINSEVWKPTHPEATALRLSVVDQLPFFEYAVTQILHHSDQAQPGISQAKFLKDFEAKSMKSWRRKCNLVQKLNVDVYKRGLDIVYACAERNLVHLIRALVDMGFKHNKFDPQQRFGSPLFAALANKSAKAARLLLELDNAENSSTIVHAMLVNEPPKRNMFDQVTKYPPWLWAVRHGCDELALHFITMMADKSDLAAFDNNGFTALHHAASKGCLRTVEYLTDWKRDLIDKRSSSVGHSRTALMAAVVECRIDIVDTLVSRGADVNLADDQHATALHFAAIRFDTTLLETLLNAGANINAQNIYGRNAVHYAMHGMLDATDMYKLKDSKNTVGHTDATLLLLDRGAMYDKKRLSQIEWKPLHQAVKPCSYSEEMISLWGHLDVKILKVLLSQGLDVNILDENGHTPIECIPLSACRQDVAWMDQFGMPLVFLPKVHSHTKQIIKLFVKAGASPNSQLVNLKSNMPYSLGRCPLIFYAVAQRDLDLLRQLLKDGAEIDRQYEGLSILHFAAMLADPGYTKILLQHKAQISARDFSYRTPLHVAVLFGHPAVVQVLLQAGAPLACRDAEFQTPSEAAMELVSLTLAAKSLAVRDAAQQCLEYIQEAEQRLEDRHSSLQILVIPDV